MTEYWYRYDDGLLLSKFPFLSKFRVVRHTTFGVQLDRADGTLKFVNKGWIKRFACPTIEEARESYLRRKQRQVQLLTNQLEEAKRFLVIAESGKFDDVGLNGSSNQ